MSKDPASNTVYLTAVVSPALAQLADLDFSAVFVPDFQVAESSALYDPATGKIALSFIYNSSLNNATLEVSFIPPKEPAFFYMPTSKLTLPEITNNNLALKVYS